MHLGSVYTNCYFLKNKETGELLIIDPADAPEKIEQQGHEMQGKPVAILLTHGHFDHIMAADAVRKKYRDFRFMPVQRKRRHFRILDQSDVQYHMNSYTLKPDVFCRSSGS